MPVYTWSPPLTYEARQINSQADADAWIASLTDNELRNDHDQIEIRDLTLTVDSGGTITMAFIRADSLDAAANRFHAPLGGYAYASRTSIQIALEDEANFNRRFEPYVEC